jgi:hypothetical protein
MHPMAMKRTLTVFTLLFSVLLCGCGAAKQSCGPINWAGTYSGGPTNAAALPPTITVVPSTATVQGSYDGLQEPQSITLQVAPWGQQNGETFTMAGSLSAVTQSALTYSGDLTLGPSQVPPPNYNYNPYLVLGSPQTSGGCVGIASLDIKGSTYTRQ